MDDLVRSEFRLAEARVAVVEMSDIVHGYST